MGVESSALSQGCSLSEFAHFASTQSVLRHWAQHSHVSLRDCPHGQSNSASCPSPRAKQTVPKTGWDLLETAVAEQALLKDTRTASYIFKAELLPVHAEHEELLITVSL